jgi:hypothetical protein
VTYTADPGGNIVIADPNATVNRANPDLLDDDATRRVSDRILAEHPGPLNAPTPDLLVEEDTQREEGPWRGTNPVTRPLAHGLNWLGRQTDRIMAPIDEAERVAADYYGEQGRAWSKKKLKPAEHGALENARNALKGTGVADPHANIAEGFQETGSDITRAGAAGATIVAAETGKFIVFDGAGRVVGEFTDATAAKAFRRELETGGRTKTHMHHQTPREVLKQLPEDVADNPAVRGRRGSPNRRRIEVPEHQRIHQGPGGGQANELTKQKIRELGREPTAEDVLRIREEVNRELKIRYADKK